MFYDYEDEDFYTENEYQEEIDNLKEAIKKSVKREITEEMNRLREENKKLQGIKENFDTVKKDFERKKDECDRAIRNAEYNARCARITELMEKFKIVMWSVTWENLYKQKCDKCDSWRKVKIALPSGKVVEDDCKCRKYAKIYFPKENVIYEMEDRSGGVRIWYKEKGEPGSGYIVADSSAVLPGMIIDHDKNFEDIEVKNLYTIFFTSQEECKEFCDFLNRKADYKGYGYDMEGKLVRDALMTETGFTNGSEQEEKHE